MKKGYAKRDMIGRTLIIGGGDCDIAFAKEYLSENTFDTILCADSGLDIAYALKLEVQYAMGDFDSASKEAYAWYQTKVHSNNVKTEFLSYPPEKDATDMHLVLDWAVEHLPEEIVILGATGKRMDHFMANVNVLMKPLSYGIDAYIIDKYNCIYLMDHSRVIHRDRAYGKYISFLPLTEEVTSVYLRGFRYELNGQTLTIGDSIGVSNELAQGAEAGLVEFGEGVFVVIESRAG